MKQVIFLIAGVFGGIALVLACGSGGDRVSAGNDAHAAEPNCATWEVAELSLGSLPRSTDLAVGDNTISTYQVPMGWEPFSYDSLRVQLRRCQR